MTRRHHGIANTPHVASRGVTAKKLVEETLYYCPVRSAIDRLSHGRRVIVYQEHNATTPPGGNLIRIYLSGNVNYTGTQLLGRST